MSETKAPKGQQGKKGEDKKEIETVKVPPAGDLFAVVDEKDIPIGVRGGKWDILAFHADVMKAVAEKKLKIGDYLQMNANVFKSKYYSGDTEPKHWQTNVQKKLSDYYGVEVMIRTISKVPYIYFKIPAHPAEKKEKDEKAADNTAAKPDDTKPGDVKK